MVLGFIPVSGFIKRKEKGRESEEENFNAEIKLENAWELGSKGTDEAITSMIHRFPRCLSLLG